MSIPNVIKGIQDIMRQDAGVDGDAQRISQLVWMLFLKIFDDREKEYKALDDGYVSPIPQGLRWRDWASDDEGITGDTLLDFINNKLFPGFKGLAFGPGDDPRGGIVKEVFHDAYNYMTSGTLIRQVVNKINEIDFNRSSDRHLFNEIYEKILKDLQNAGNAGEYYTPRAVTQFIVEMVDPRLGEKVLDPACGTGGFLTCTLEHIRGKKELKSAQDDETLQGQVNGVEKKPLPHLLCITNMILHGVDAPLNIRRENTLLRPIQDFKARDFVDIVVTNPPFGGIEENGIQANFPASFRTKETADLFLVLIMSILKPRGRCAIVLPDGTLFGEGVKTRIKERLLQTCNLHTIVRLPNGVFSPYTGIKTNLLFFSKGEPTREVWFYEHPYPPGYKSYSKTKPMRIEEFGPEKEWWNHRVENEFAWKVSIEKIIENNYNLDIKNPNTPDEDHGDPVQLLADFKRYAAEVESVRGALKKELMEALGREGMMVVLFDNFDILVEGPDGIRKLRELILQLAVMGKLVSQDPEDEPAAVLLEKIKAEKERLIKEGKIKRQNPLPDIKDDEKPYDLPLGWIWVRLGEIGQIIGGGTPKTGKPDYFSENGIAWVTPADLYSIKSKYVSRGKRDISLLGLQKSSAQLMPAGTVLFSSRAPIGYVAIAENALSTNQGFKSCVPFIREINLYLYYYLKCSAKEIDANATGTTFKEVSGKVVSLILCPLPPLNEQKRIVAKVERLMSFCDRLQENLKNAETKSDHLFNAVVNHLQDLSPRSPRARLS